MLSNGRYLKEMANVIKQHPEFEWHVGGFGELEDYFKKLSNNYHNIYFYGKLQYSEVLFLEGRCDIMTAIYDPSVPNHKYAAPNKFYESLMLGKPVIMMKNTGMDRIVSKYRTGEVIDLSNQNFSTAFLDSIIKISKDKNMISEEYVRSLYKKMFSWNIMEKRLLRAYGDL